MAGDGPLLFIELALVLQFRLGFLLGKADNSVWKSSGSNKNPCPAILGHKETKGQAESINKVAYHLQ